MPEGRKLKLLKGNTLQEAIDEILRDSGGQPSHDPTLSDGEKVNLISNSIARSFVQAQNFSSESAGDPIISSGLYHINRQLSAEAILDAVLKYHYPTDKSVLSKINIVACDQPTHTCFVNRMTELKHGTNRTAPTSLSTSPGAGPGVATNVASETVNLVTTGESSPTPPETTGMYLNIY